MRRSLRNAWPMDFNRGKNAVELAAAGIDNFAHLVRDMEMSDALIATMNAKGIYVMPNIGVRGTPILLVCCAIIRSASPSRRNSR
jgi:hypothetical protein